MQNFKGDELELKFLECIRPITSILSLDKNDFLADAYDCELLGNMIYNLQNAPVVKNVVREVFRKSFNEVFKSFESAGSFETYISVFTKIFGEDVIVEFVEEDFGHLIINITATTIDLVNIEVRELVAEEYFSDILVDDLNENILFKVFKVVASQYEIEQMLYEMVPMGVFVEINLSVG